MTDAVIAIASSPHPKPGRLKRLLLMGAGYVLMGVGVLMIPLPGPFGLPVALFGAVLVLRESMSARRMFVRMKRKHPKTFGALHRILRAGAARYAAK